MAPTLWHKAPFLRLLILLTTGIVLQRYLTFALPLLLCVFAICFLAAAIYSFTNIRRRYRLGLVNNIAFTGLFVAVGALLVWLHDVRNNKDWIGHFYKEGNSVLVTLQEPLVEKAASFKALATVEAVLDSTQATTVKGTLIVYFKKDSLPPLHYGSRLVFKTPLQAVKNAGNPGCFDYKTYCLFNGITHQVYLAGNDFSVLPGTHTNAFDQSLLATRSWVVKLLQRYIPGEKEQGLAEALLIGYKDDLDKNLVQAYSNTGVVHIIAISGLHLGLIYWLLLWLTKPLKRSKKLVWLRALLIVASLWGFSVLAGAGPSVLRSAVMFTAIALGEVLLRRTNIINTLAFSAAVLLCMNPFWLWDVGFQLSYSAVLSIVLFYKPVYGWLHFTNKGVDFLWGLTAVTIAAQLLTTPISVYHFHQMPLLFLFTNFIAVPLSSLVLLAEILLCAVFFLPPLAHLVGDALHYLIYWMNSYIEGLSRLPFAVWNGLSIDVWQTLLLLIFVVGFCYWLMEKQRRFARMAFAALAVFAVLRGLSFYEAFKQKKLIVYNVPKHTAIDLIEGRHYSFFGDTALLFDDFARNFHLQPSRILHRISPADADAGMKSFEAEGKRVIIFDRSIALFPLNDKPVVDVLVLSKNPRLYLSNLAKAFTLKQVVIDGSVPAWKAALWKRDCDSLKMPCYNVGEDGAFVLDL